MQPPDSSRWAPREFLASLRVPAIAIGLLLVPFAIYFIHVRAQREYLISRNFRTLAVMSDQIKVMVNNYQSVITNSCNAVARGIQPVSDEPSKCPQKPTVEQFLKRAYLNVVDESPTCKKVPGPFYLSFGFEGQDADAWLHVKDKVGESGIDVKIKLRDVLNQFMQSEGNTAFDDVLVADQHEGRVLYQLSRSGLRFTEVNVFLQETTSTPETADSVVAPPGKVRARRRIFRMAHLRICAFGPFLFREPPDRLLRDRNLRRAIVTGLPEPPFSQVTFHNVTGAIAPRGHRVYGLVSRHGSIGHDDLRAQ
jgi:hypothetical protein